MSEFRLRSEMKADLITIGEDLGATSPLDLMLCLKVDVIPYHV